MDLRHFLFENEITQQALIKGIRSVGFDITESSLSLILRKKRKPAVNTRQAIFHGLRALKIPLRVIESIDEFQSLPKPTATKVLRKKPAVKSASVGSN